MIPSADVEYTQCQAPPPQTLTYISQVDHMGMMWQWWQIAEAKNQDVYDVRAVHLIGNLTPDWVVFDMKDDCDDGYDDDYNDADLRSCPLDGELRARLGGVRVLADQPSQPKVGHLSVIILM